MISPREAALAARDYLNDLSLDEQFQHLRVEEVELVDDDKFWHVILGWLEVSNRNVGTSGTFVRPTVEALPRVYRVFKVDAETGKVISMKMHG